MKYCLEVAERTLLLTKTAEFEARFLFIFTQLRIQLSVEANKIYKYYRLSWVIVDVYLENVCFPEVIGDVSWMSMTEYFREYWENK